VETGRPVARDEAVDGLRCRRETRNVPVGRENPMRSGRFGERLERRLGSREDITTGSDKDDRALEDIARDFGKALPDLLRRRVVDALSRLGPPPADPSPSESSAAVENQKRPRGRDRDALVQFHGASLGGSGDRKVPR